MVLALLVALALRVVTGSDRWTLAAFALSTAVSIGIGVRARRVALEERSRLLHVEEQARQDVSRSEENQAKARPQPRWAGHCQHGRLAAKSWFPG